MAAPGPRAIRLGPAGSEVHGRNGKESSMTFGVMVTGDELLVGKRQDKHLSFAIQALARRGLRLAWAEYHGDDPPRLTAALQRSFGSGDVVLSFGGIGATPDDHTRQSAADALGVPQIGRASCRERGEAAGGDVEWTNDRV